MTAIHGDQQQGLAGRFCRDGMTQLRNYSRNSNLRSVDSTAFSPRFISSCATSSFPTEYLLGLLGSEGGHACASWFAMIDLGRGFDYPA